MKKYAVMMAGLVCLGLIFAGFVRAEEKAAPQNTAQVIAPRCPEVTELEARVKAKKDEIQAVEAKIKTLKDAQKAKHDAEKAEKEAQRKARLEELKQKDPAKYQKEMVEQAEREKKHEEMKKQREQEHKNKPEINHAEWLQHLQQKNPPMYDLVVQKDKLQDELKMLRDQLQSARKACHENNKTNK